MSDEKDVLVLQVLKGFFSVCFYLSVSLLKFFSGSSFSVLLCLILKENEILAVDAIEKKSNFCT